MIQGGAAWGNSMADSGSAIIFNQAPDIIKKSASMGSLPQPVPQKITVTGLVGEPHYEVPVLHDQFSR
jgi:hypothetical protein